MTHKIGNCRNYNGECYRDGDCDAGINVRQLVGGEDAGWLQRIPCFAGKEDCTCSCDSFESYTQADLDREDAEYEAWMAKFRLTGPIIAQVKREHKGESWSGVVECPVCQGKLHMSHAAYNGHVHGKCETENCMSWME